MSQPSSEQHFNGLTPEEAELLALLSEECGEVVQIIGKIQRHGLASYHPAHPNGPNNRQMLNKELGDVAAAVALLNERFVVSNWMIQQARNEKLRALPKYLHHATVPAEFTQEVIEL